MITVVKQNPRGEPKIQYQGEILERLASGVIIQAYWSQATKHLGYTTFEPGDRFIEYYYTNRWYNIFDIADANGVRKGWYVMLRSRRFFLMSASSRLTCF